jgi:hypothetical protein
LQEKKQEVDLILSDINLMVETETGSADDRPPSPLPVTTHRKPVVKSNSMKRSTTYIPSAGFGKTSQASGSPQRSASLSHRRSQSATFLSQQASAGVVAAALKVPFLWISVSAENFSGQIHFS